ncbi:amidohydrolase family protein [Streptomyces showdoensis]|uniref:Hydrolase n=1 Tax=Streptomyces showdoensis TaxID=68268 RepID=A0A2P2GJD5_STREW|nr:amidohydrolase family protein [Streptomyces showdoensis]KKZ71622.1 hydrolase [Streptomyces showdoensis]
MPAHRIDVHAHYFGGAVAAQAAKQPSPGNRAPWSAEATLEAMERTETAVQILSVPFTPQGGSEAKGLARRINEDLAHLIGRHPQRFGALACLPGDDPDAMLDELAYALDVLRLDGVALTSNVAGRYLGNPWWQPLLAELDRRAVPVLVHPTSCPHATELALGRHPSVIEYPFDTARTITDALFAGVFHRHPDLNLILPHLGGPLPALAWRIAECAAMPGAHDPATVTPEHVTDVLATLYYDTAMGGSPHALLPALQVTSTDHLLFGTDAGAAPATTIDRAITALTTTLQGNGLNAIEHANALRLFPRLAAR